jgi:SAM-dependent methyltransferase
MMEKEKVRKTVRDGYAKIARDTCSCGTAKNPCCSDSTSANQFFSQAGYSAEEIASVPEGAVVGLACGNPLSFAKPVAGETVLDLGSGPGLDCFLAAKAVGSGGRVIGVDMTPEMIDKARENAASGGYQSVEFRLGEIEHLPAADSSVDIIISNCVINLSPEKGRVFSEAFRVLKPGGRLVVSDIVLLKLLPDALRDSKDLLVGCVANAEMKDSYLELIREAGFHEVGILQEKGYPVEGCGEETKAASIVVRGVKPRARHDTER